MRKMYERAGLLYVLRDDGTVQFGAYDPFTVDGIDYDHAYAENCIRPMFAIAGNGCSPAWMRTDVPPTEEELDHYVRTGYLPEGDA